jgi:NADPH2:quinone reductase
VAAEGQALVRVRAAGINFMDCLVRRGEYPQPPELPTVLGVEVAGEVDGRRVIGLPRHGGGGYAEVVAVEEDALVPLPDGASFAEGAAFLMTFLTAYIPLTSQVRVGEGTTVLVHAGSGGVGSAAIQLARHFGARVVATASSEEKRRVAREIGAEETYSYDDFAEHVRADVVVDPVGGELLPASLKVLNPLGFYVALGYAGGPWPSVDPALLVGRSVALAGLYLGRLMKLAPDVVAHATRRLLELWQEGAVRPVVGAQFPLEDAADAHRLIDERKHVGKVVLVP